MKIAYVFICLVICISCQLSRRLLPLSPERSLSSTETIEVLESEVVIKTELNNSPKLIIRHNNLDLKSISFKNTQGEGEVNCSGKNTVKLKSKNITKFFLNPRSVLWCSSNINNTQEFSIKFSDIDKNTSQVLKTKSKKADEIHKMLLEKNYYNSLVKRVNLEEFKKVKFSKNDFVHIELSPDIITQVCPDKKCVVKSYISGTSIFFDYNKVSGFNQLKYPHIEPFIFICGSRFSGSNIKFRSDVKTSFSTVVDDNGLSCDLNSFSLEDEKINYSFNLIHIPANHKLQVESNKSRVIKRFIELNENFNMHAEKLGQDMVQNEKGYIEAFIEQSGDEFVLSKFKLVLIKNKKRSFYPLNIPYSWRFKDEGIRSSKRITMCFDDFKKNFINNFSDISEYQNPEKLCAFPGIDYGEALINRWLFKIIRKEDLGTEDYQLIEAPPVDIGQPDKLIFNSFIENSLSNSEREFKNETFFEVYK